MQPLPRHYRKKQIFLQTFNLGDKGNSAFAGIPFCLLNSYKTIIINSIYFDKSRKAWPLK